LSDAIDHYDEISPLLGDRFRKMVDARFRSSLDPDHVTMRWGDNQ